jgi:hypothetical protein
VTYGSGLNPSTQDMTWNIAINVPSGSTGADRVELGPSIGTNQRAYICAIGGTWRIAVQARTCTNAGASNLTVDAGWNFLTLIWNSTTDVATLSKNGITGTGGATGSYTSFILASNLQIGRVTGNAAPGGTYDDFSLYLTVEDPASLYAAWLATTPIVGSFAQPATRFQAVYLVSGSPVNYGTAINQSQSVVAGGAVAILFQIHCENIADCDQDSFRLEERKNGTGSWVQVPDMETDEGIWMWGTDNDPLLNSGTTSSRLTGSCTVTNGVTLLLSSQVPVVDLPQDGCVMLRFIVRIGSNTSNYYDLRITTQNGTAFAGAYQYARLTAIPVQAQGGAF